MINNKRLWVHLLIIALTVGYFLAAPRIYARYLRKYGKPIPYTEVIPDSGSQLVVSPLELSSSWIEDEDVYQVSGWSFAANLETNTQRYLVLENGNLHYFFPFEIYPRYDLMNLFGSDAHLDAGIKAVVAKNVLPFGIYRIGVLFDSDNSTLFVRTNQNMIFKANQVSIEQYSIPVEEVNLAVGYKIKKSSNLVSDFIYGFTTPILSESAHQQCILLSGYVFSEAIHNQQPVSISLLVESNDGIYEFPTVFSPRPDVPISVERIDIGDPGFLGCIPTARLSENGTNVGLRLIYAEGDYYQWTQLNLMKAEGKLFTGAEEILGSN